MSEQSRAGTLFTTWLTSSDRVDHAVTDEQFHDNRPEPETVCGVTILLAPMETPPGPRCARCTAFLAARASLSGLEQRLDPHRHRRTSWLGRLLHPNTSAVPGPRALARDGRFQAPVDTVGSPAAVSTGPDLGATS
ncbi:hypothetical protein BCF44_104323 [Kutzneria buriramensis]|uniref:Uncharacterized protein n=1 Tax=Kutzneria buriramensis TaxID=1045776 RepID=A0A3E0HVR3_9PSEU|nr:hypothetical protein BCF44_104323 [Kutzneria buriramensis]